MESKHKLCLHCEKLKSALKEKENEIEKLKLHIKNLSNFLLWRGDNISTMVDAEENSKSVCDIKMNDTNEQKFNSDFFRISCQKQGETIIMKSKSIQTENAENLVLPDLTEESAKVTQSNIGEMHDYVYDNNYQMYYSLSTGYYYDEKSGLMYEPQSCTYYRYNYDKKEYEKVSHEEEETGNVNNDESVNNYICQSVVEQVNNLNLNDESPKMEKYDEKVENFTVEGSINHDENPVDADTTKLLEKDNVSLECTKDWQPTEGSKLTVTDMVKQVVDEHNNMSDYIYDDQYQMYYSPSTGYFYDAVRNLLYDPTNGIYYSYDQDKQTYEFYYQTNPDITSNDQSATTEDNLKNVKKQRLKSRKVYWKKKLENVKRSPEIPKLVELGSQMEEFDKGYSSPEDGEIFSSDGDSDDPGCIVRSPVKGPSTKLKSEELFPPSIRAIVEHSESLQIGSLILITCSGGIIGRDTMNAVYLPDICVSKMHANITFNSDSQTYSIEDLGSQNGTFINGRRLSESKLKSEPCTLSHGDKLSLGSCKLLLHIHEGYETCDCCEPGQVLAEISSNTEKTAVVLSKAEKEKHRREELRKLKKKYGLQGAHFERPRNVVQSQDYEDKAEIRRHAVGSDNPYEKTETASTDVSMPESNKGYQMLKKMGWKEGQTLGATDSGLKEPIPLRNWTSKAGLGAGEESSMKLPVDKRSRKWVKAQERYFQLSLEKEPF